jgi:hypothetical protein
MRIAKTSFLRLAFLLVPVGLASGARAQTVSCASGSYSVSVGATAKQLAGCGPTIMVSNRGLVAASVAVSSTNSFSGSFGVTVAPGAVAPIPSPTSSPYLLARSVGGVTVLTISTTTQPTPFQADADHVSYSPIAGGPTTSIRAAIDGLSTTFSGLAPIVTPTFTGPVTISPGTGSGLELIVASGTGAQPSQALTLSSRDSGSTRRPSSIFSDANGNPIFRAGKNGGLIALQDYNSGAGANIAYFSTAGSAISSPLAVLGVITANDGGGNAVIRSGANSGLVVLQSYNGGVGSNIAYFGAVGSSISSPLTISGGLTAPSVTTTSFVYAVQNAYVNAGTAMPSGGVQDQGINFSTTAHFGIYFGSGAPTVNAAKGSLYLRSDGSTTTSRAYINTDGATTWTAITTVI